MKERIMLVENEPGIAKLIKLMLQNAGYSVSAIFSSGEEAVQMVNEVNPDLIIMDVSLAGDMDGIEATEIINDSANIPVVYLTANSNPSIMNRANSTRHYGYILKPVKQDFLDSIISIALRKHRLESLED